MTGPRPIDPPSGIERRRRPESLLAGLDLNALIGRVDLDAVLAGVDLVGIAGIVIDGVDLPEIIRGASTSVTGDVVTDVRSTGERADDAVAHAVSRLLRRGSGANE